ALLSGTVRPEMSGYSPTLGASWDLVTASELLGRFDLDVSGLPDLPRGVGYSISQNKTTATLRYTNKLILSVDRNSGAATLQNVIGAPITFDAYTITSPSGALSGAWNSLADQGLSSWQEADNANSFRRTEFNPLT